MIDAATCEAALQSSAHVADAAAACAELIETLQRGRRLSEDDPFATFDEVQDYVDLACVVIIVACAALAA